MWPSPLTSGHHKPPPDLLNMLNMRDGRHPRDEGWDCIRLWMPNKSHHFIADFKLTCNSNLKEDPSSLSDMFYVLPLGASIPQEQMADGGEKKEWLHLKYVHTINIKYLINQYVELHYDVLNVNTITSVCRYSSKYKPPDSKREEPGENISILQISLIPKCTAGIYSHAERNHIWSNVQGTCMETHVKTGESVLFLLVLMVC